VAALAGDGASLIGHVAFETTAAMSRMPQGHRLAPPVVLAWLERRFPAAPVYAALGVDVAWV
jgi:hypothetical protein